MSTTDEVMARVGFGLFLRAFRKNRMRVKQMLKVTIRAICIKLIAPIYLFMLIVCSE